MKNKNKNNLGLNVLIALGVIILASTFVTGFGVITEYTNGNPLKLEPGQTADTFFFLQNTGDDAVDTVAEGEIVEGSEIASFIGESSYSIPAGEGIQVDVRIIIPEDAAVGTEYTVEGLFSNSGEGAGEGGSIDFNLNMAKSFKVLVVDDSPISDTGSSNFWYWVIGIIILIIIIWFAMKAMKK